MFFGYIRADEKRTHLISIKDMTTGRYMTYCGRVLPTKAAIHDLPPAQIPAKCAICVELAVARKALPESIQRAPERAGAVSGGSHGKLLEENVAGF